MVYIGTSLLGLKQGDFGTFGILTEKTGLGHTVTWIHWALCPHGIAPPLPTGIRGTPRQHPVLMSGPFTEAVVVKAPAPLLFSVGVHQISQHGVLLLLLLF